MLFTTLATDPGQAAESALLLGLTYLPAHDPQPDAKELAKVRAAMVRAAKVFDAAGKKNKLGRAAVRPRLLR